MDYLEDKNTLAIHETVFENVKKIFSMFLSLAEKWVCLTQNLENHLYNGTQGSWYEYFWKSLQEEQIKKKSFEKMQKNVEMYDFKALTKKIQQSNLQTSKEK